MPELPSTEKLQSAQLVRSCPSTPKLQSVRLVPPGTATESQSQQRNRPAIVKGNAGHQALWKPNPGERDWSRRSKNFQWYRLATSWPLHTSSDASTMSVDAGIKNWQYYGQEHSGEQDYDHSCKHGWNKGALPGQGSEQERAAEDSGSSSTDARVEQSSVSGNSTQHRHGRVGSVGGVRGGKWPSACQTILGAPKHFLVCLSSGSRRKKPPFQWSATCRRLHLGGWRDNRLNRRPVRSVDDQAPAT